MLKSFLSDIVYREGEEWGEFCTPPPLDGSMTGGTWKGVQSEVGVRSWRSWRKGRGSDLELVCEIARLVGGSI